MRVGSDNVCGKPIAAGSRMLTGANFETDASPMSAALINQYSTCRYTLARPTVEWPVHRTQARKTSSQVSCFNSVWRPPRRSARPLLKQLSVWPCGAPNTSNTIKAQHGSEVKWFCPPVAGEALARGSLESWFKPSNRPPIRRFWAGGRPRSDERLGIEKACRPEMTAPARTSHYSSSLRDSSRVVAYLSHGGYAATSQVRYDNPRHKYACDAIDVVLLFLQRCIHPRIERLPLRTFFERLAS